MEHQTLAGHVLIFPIPVQGHVNSMLKLAELLCLAGVHVTFLATPSTHNRLTSYTDVVTRFSGYPGFKFELLPDDPFDGDLYDGERIVTLISSLRASLEPFLRELPLRYHQSDGLRPPVTCIIADSIFTSAIDIAKDIGVSIVLFRTSSSCSFWAYFCIPRLIKAEELPFRGSDMDTPVENVAGMEAFLRRRDLPSFCRVSDLSSPDFNLVMTKTQEFSRADGLIFNTFEDLEGPVVSHIRSHCPNVYTIGPLHAHLKARLAVKSSSSAPSSNSLWKEDRSCIKWLDDQPSKSVIYVSFGSITVLTRDQLLEFWYGLVNSGTRFLWVIRPDSVTGKDKSEDNIPVVLKEATKERGYMVDWVPQEQVLAHQAIGGFLTHSGWNSTLESIVEGVPMICWPFFADQQVNSRFVGEVWKLGLDIKDTCDRAIIEKAVRELMETRKDEFQERASRMAKLAHDAISEGGTSCQSLDRLIQDIKSAVVPL